MAHRACESFFDDRIQYVSEGTLRAVRESGQKSSAELHVSPVLSTLDAHYLPLEESCWIFSLKKHLQATGPTTLLVEKKEYLVSNFEFME